MKKTIALLVTITILLTYSLFAAADSGTAAGTASAGTASLVAGTAYTIAELQAMAVQNSRQALADDVAIKKAETALKNVHSDVAAMSDSILITTKPMTLQLAIDVAKKTKEDHAATLKNDVYKTSMNILLSLEEIKLKEQKLAFSKERLDLAKSKLKGQTGTQDDVDSAAYEVDSSNVDLSTAKEKLNSLYLELRKLLNQPLNTEPVKISAQLTQAVWTKLDMDQALTSLYKTETSVVKAQRNADIAQTAMDIAAKLYVTGDSHYDDAVLDMDQAKLDLAAAQSALDVKVKNAYNDALSKLDNVDLTGSYVSLLQKKLANTKLKYDKGTVSKDVYTSAREASLDAAFARLTAIAGFNAAKADLDLLLRAG